MTGKPKSLPLILLPLAVMLAWLLLNPWRPMELPGPAELEALGGSARHLPEKEGMLPPERRPLPAGPGRSLVLFDAVTRKPLAGAALFLLDPGPRLLGVSGEEGRVDLPVRFDPGRLLCRRPGHLGLFLGLETDFCRRLQALVLAGRGALGLAPDSITSPCTGLVLGLGGEPRAGAAVTLVALEPADPVHPAEPCPPGLRAAWRMSLAVEQLLGRTPRESPWEMGRWTDRVSCRSDGEGRFAFRTLSRGPALLAAVGPARRRTARLRCELPRREPPPLRLRPGAFLRVAPAAGGELKVSCGDGWLLRGKAGERLGPLVPGERVRVELLRPPREAAAREITLPPAGETILVTFPGEADRLEWAGRVVGAGRGEGVAGVLLRAVGGGRASSGGQGRFRLDLPRQGPVVVTLAGPGIAPRRLEIDPAAPPPRVRVLPAGREAQVEAGLLSALEGRVESVDGRPLAGALVRAFPLGAELPGGLRPDLLLGCRSGRGGGFRLYLPPGRDYRIEAIHLLAGWGEKRLATPPGGGPVADLVVRLQPPLEVEGEVTRRRGSAAGLVLIFSRRGAASVQVRTGPGGTFRVRLPAPGAWRVTILTEAGPSRQDLEVSPGSRLVLEI